MTEKMADAECIDKIWNQYSSKWLNSACILNGLLSLDQFRYHGFEDTQIKMILHVWMLQHKLSLDQFRNHGFEDIQSKRNLHVWILYKMKAEDKRPQ